MVIVRWKMVLIFCVKICVIDLTVWNGYDLHVMFLTVWISYRKRLRFRNVGDFYVGMIPALTNFVPTSIFVLAWFLHWQISCQQVFFRVGMIFYQARSVPRWKKFALIFSSSFAIIKTSMLQWILRFKHNIFKRA